MTACFAGARDDKTKSLTDLDNGTASGENTPHDTRIWFRGVTANALEN